MKLRARISLFRSDVKDTCNAITLASFVAMPSPEYIKGFVKDHLSSYNYTFPTSNASTNTCTKIRVLLTSGKVDGSGRLLRRTRPYRNPRIIQAIRDLYFSGGGTASFAARFSHLFPVFQDSDGKTNREVPIPMVALVATAVSPGLDFAIREADTVAAWPIALCQYK